MLMGTDPLRELGSTAAPIDRSDENGGSPAKPIASCGDLTAAPHGSTPRALPAVGTPQHRFDRASGQAVARARHELAHHQHRSDVIGRWDPWSGAGSSRSPCPVGRNVGRDRAQTSRAALRHEGTSTRMGSRPDPCSPDRQ
jgi:hypothetical protein